MKKTILSTLLLAGFVAPLFAAGTNALSDEKSKVSYAIGMSIGTDFKRQNIDVDTAIFLHGLEDAKSGSPTLLTMPEMMTVLKEFQQTMVAKQAKLRADQALTNKVAGEAFLATNKNNPGVITLPDGLQYKVITTGTGATPSADSVVTVNYTGTFLDGTEFDSTAKQGHPTQLPANQFVKGWTEALTQMKVGSKWQLFVPSELAYGERGGRIIPPNSTLIFELELLDTQAPAAVAPPVAAAPLTSDIIKVPSKAEMDKGAKIETLKPEDVKKIQSQSHTNH